MKISNRMLVMFGIYLVGMGVLFGLSLSTIAKVKVNGPIYSEIVKGKDLAADILPPPEYILESYLVVQLAHDSATPAERQKLFEKFKQLKKDFDERHEYWQKELPEGEVKKTLLEDAYRPAAAFTTTPSTSSSPRC